MSDNRFLKILLIYRYKLLTNNKMKKKLKFILNIDRIYLYRLNLIYIYFYFFILF